MDSADKATNKAMSAAYKYAAFQAFAIPTQGDNDADATTHEVLNPEVAEWKKKLTTAENMDELVEVWKAMPANLREPLKFVKDNAKARLSVPIKEAA